MAHALRWSWFTWGFVGLGVLLFVPGRPACRAAPPPAPKVLVRPRLVLPVRGASDVVFTADGRMVATVADLPGDFTSEVRLRDTVSGALVRTLPHRGEIEGLILSPAGELVTSVSGPDATSAVWFWDPKTWQIRRKVRLDDHTLARAVSPDGKTLATERLSCAGLWDIATGALRLSLEPVQHKVVDTLTFSPDGRVLAVGVGSGHVLLCDPSTGKRLRLWKAHSNHVFSLAFAPDGERLLTSSGVAEICESLADDPIPPGEAKRCPWGEAKVWDVRTGRLLHTVVRKSPICSAVFSKDGRSLIIGGGNFFGPGEVARASLRTGKVQRILQRGIYDVYRMALSPDGKVLAASALRMQREYASSELVLWDL